MASFFQRVFNPAFELDDATGIILKTEDDGSTKRLGTGFSISPIGHVLTAGHLFEDGDNLAIEFENLGRFALSVEKHKVVPESGADFAICRAKAGCKTRFPFVALRFPRTCNGNVALRGYGATLHDKSSAQGSFVGFLDVGGRASNRLFQFSSAQSGEKGFSGSGVLSLSYGAVVAIQTEAVGVSVGPQRDTVLAYPLTHIRSEITAGVPLLTRWAWLICSQCRTVLKRPLYLFFAVLLMLTGIIGPILAARVLNTAWHISRFAYDSDYSKKDIEESRFWAGPLGQQFAKDNPDPTTYHQNIHAFVVKNKLDHTILDLSGRYEALANCAIQGLCISKIVCHSEFDRIWIFYHAYQGFFRQHQALMNFAPDTKMMEFLKRQCPTQLEKRCTSIDSRQGICGPNSS